MSAPGCFNDPDMLIVGMYGKGHVGVDSGCTDTEYEAHFAYWCMAGAPLMIGGDIRNMSPFCEKLLKNQRIIAIDQDEEARPPYKVHSNCVWDDDRVYIKHLADNRFAIAFFNCRDKEMQQALSFYEAGIPFYTGVTLDLTDAISGEHIGIIDQDAFSCSVPSHGCRIFTAEFAKR